MIQLRKPKGLRGEIRCELVVPEVVDPDELIAGRTFWLRRVDQVDSARRVESLVPYQGYHLARIEGVEDRDAAEAVRGGELCLRREDLPELPEGWFWEDDLLGAKVTDVGRGEIGEVCGLDTVAGRMQIIVRTSGGGNVTVPLVPALVLVLDVGEGRVETDLPADYPGLDA